MKADLHSHTNASDAFLSRQELLETAAAQGVEVLAITDHDTMKNSFSTPEDPVRVVEGCELSSQDGAGHMVHILCYLPWQKQVLEPYFMLMHHRRQQAGETMLERVNRLFPVVTRERVARYSAPSGVIHKQDLMNVLIDFGYADTLYGDLYQQLFGRKNGSCIQRFPYDDTRKMIHLAKEAGGVVVIAHAGESNAIPLVEELARAGEIDGAEVMHPRNTEDDRRALREICSRFGLIETGGSDFHGRNNSRSVLPGDCQTDSENLKRLFELHEQRR